MQGAHYSRDTVYIRYDSNSRDSRNFMDVNSSRTVRIRQQESQQQWRSQQQSGGCNRYKRTSQMSTAEERPSKEGRPETHYYFC
jgi:hypothetical protein